MSGGCVGGGGDGFVFCFFVLFVGFVGLVLRAEKSITSGNFLVIENAQQLQY